MVCYSGSFYVVPSLTHHLFRDFERTVFGAYRWLSDNYEPGDCIFLFGELDRQMKCISLVPDDYTGFSRGAFQVRVLSAMIDKVLNIITSAFFWLSNVSVIIQVGLIHKGNEMQIPLYAS